MLSKLSVSCCRWRYVGPATFVVLLVIGLVITNDTVQDARRTRENVAYADHASLTITASKVMISTYISPVSAAITARHIIQNNVQNWNATAGGSAASFRGVRPLLEAMAGSFSQFNMTFVGLSAMLHDERPAYESWLTSKCAAAFDGSDVRLIRAADVNRRASALPVPVQTVYPSIVDLEIQSGSLAARCAIGLDFSQSDPHMRIFMEAVDTARLSWQPPLPFLVAGPGVRPPQGSRNIGLLLPLHARTAELAGPAGVAQTLAVSSRPDLHASLPVVCDRTLSQPPTLACGQARRALGAVAVPMYPTTPLKTLVDTVPHVRNVHITMLYVPRALEDLVQLEGGNVDARTGRRRMTTAEDPLEDAAYLDDSYLERTSWTLQRGSLAPLLRASDPGNILMCVRYRDSQHVQGAGSAPSDWLEMDPFTSREEAIKADADSSILQSARAFALGRNLYILILRDTGSTFSPEFEQAQALTWTLGGLLTALAAVALPLFVHMFIKQQERQHAMQMAVVQSEKDGVVQAVAFAAHEIRNPMHGVLASLETGLDDLQPLLALLKEAVKADTIADSESSEEVSGDARTLLRLLGRDGCDTALVALEDVFVAKTSAESCHRLINDMVDYSKLQRGIMSIEVAPMDVRVCLRALLEAQRSFLGASVRTFMAVHADVPDRLQTDQVRIMQVITNGVTNAGKFTSKGAIYATCMLLDTSDVPPLHLKHNPSHQWICFVVCDTGKGLAGIDVDALFEPGNTGAPSPTSSPFRLARLTALFQAAASTLAARLGRAGGRQGGSAPLPAPSSGIDSPSAAKTETIRQSVFASSVAKMRGSGLGLPVARLMARAMGGDVDLYTEPVNRLNIPLTRFIFALPMSAMDGSLKTPVSYPLFGRSGHLSLEARQAFRQKIIGRLGNKIHQVEELMGGSAASTAPLPGCLTAFNPSSEAREIGRGGSRREEEGEGGGGASKDGCRGDEGSRADPVDLCPCGPPAEAEGGGQRSGLSPDSVAVSIHVHAIERSISVSTTSAASGKGGGGASASVGSPASSSNANPTPGSSATPSALGSRLGRRSSTSPVLGPVPPVEGGEEAGAHGPTSRHTEVQ